MLDVDQGDGDIRAKRLEEEEESTETLVCTVLSELQNLGEHLKISKVCLLWCVYFLFRDRFHLFSSVLKIK